jgi:uncharacterized C2H2 Zn-finger protein
METSFLTPDGAQHDAVTLDHYGLTTELTASDLAALLQLLERPLTLGDTSYQLRLCAKSVSGGATAWLPYVDWSAWPRTQPGMLWSAQRELDALKEQLEQARATNAVLRADLACAQRQALEAQAQAQPEPAPLPSRHVSMVAPQAPAPSSAAELSAPEAAHACPECGQAFKNSQGLGAHRARAHGVPGTYLERRHARTPVQPVTCPACGEAVDNRGIARHLTVTHGWTQEGYQLWREQHRAASNAAAPEGEAEGEDADIPFTPPDTTSAEALLAQLPLTPHEVRRIREQLPRILVEVSPAERLRIAAANAQVDLAAVAA